MQDFETTDTRARRFKNVGNSCYINATLQALFAIPSVQQLYERDDLWIQLSDKPYWSRQKTPKTADHFRFLS